MNTNSFSSIVLTSKYKSSQLYKKTNESLSNNYVLVKNRNNQLMRKYFLNYDYYIRQYNLYAWRKNVQAYISKVIIEENIKQGKNQQIQLYCDHIVKYLKQLSNLSIQESIDFLRKMIYAYQQIQKKIGYVCVDDQFVGLNSCGQVVVWISKNLSSNYGEGIRLKNQYEIIAKSILITYQKCKEKEHPFYCSINFVQPKFSSIKSFIIRFEEKLYMNTTTIKKQKQSLIQINSNSSKNNIKNKNFNHITEQSQIQKNQKKQRISLSRFSPIINYEAQNKKSIINNSQMMSPTTQSQFIDQKTTLKVNFSYSHKRSQLFTPKNQIVPKQYTSQNNFLVIEKQRQPNRIQQFQLQEKSSNKSKQKVQDNKIQKEDRNKANKQQKYNNFKIGREFSIYYLPSANLIIIKERSDLEVINRQRQFMFFNKTSMTSFTCKQNKTSMTTNSQTQTNSRFSNILMKNSSESDEIIPRILNMTTSNSSSYNNSNLKTNFYSHIHNSHNQIQKHSHKQKSNMNTYTFGGLITVDQEQENKNSRKSSSQESERLHQKQYKKQNNKSIEELYNNLYFNEQENKSIIIQKNHTPQKHECVQNSFHYNKLDSFTSKQNSFNIDAWKNIKNLLNQSQTDLKESIHCGPEIRSPVNIKLQMLGKFGRDIGKSIIPNH